MVIILLSVKDKDKGIFQKSILQYTLFELKPKLNVKCKYIINDTVHVSKFNIRYEIIIVFYLFWINCFLNPLSQVYFGHDWFR